MREVEFEHSLEAKGICKSFPGVRANESVDFDLRAGEIHALLGENGAGKSTLAHILAGALRADSGSIEVDGKQVLFKSPRDAMSAGVGLVAQHFDLVPALTVAENVLLADDRQPWLWSSKRAAKTLEEISTEFGFELDPGALVRELTLGEQQQLEIVRLLYRGGRVLILDEPTSVLTPQQASVLFASLRAMAQQGRSIVIISHKLSEILSVADRITVMRDGRVIGTVLAAETDGASLARMMVGRDVELQGEPRRLPAGAPVLTVSGVGTEATDGRSALREIDLVVHEREIVGVAGVSGNGQTLLAEVISGLRKPSAGQIAVNGRDVTRSGPVDVREAGLRYIPGERMGVGLAPGLSICDNVVLTDRLPVFMRRSKMERRAEEAIERFDVRARGVESPVKLLSGGNAQKLLLARELAWKSDALVVVSPTWGLDVGAVSFVHDQLRRRQDDGGAILLISEDLDEICSLSNRVLVMFGGRIVGEFQGPHYDLDALGLAMAGAQGFSGPGEE